MSGYTLKVDGLSIATGSTYLNLLGLKNPSTATLRCRLRKLVIGGQGVPQNAQVLAQAIRTNNATDGTSTAVNVNEIAPANRNLPASQISAIGSAYTVAPTTLENGPVAGGPTNHQGALVLEYAPDDAKDWLPGQTLVIQAWQSYASSALPVSVTVEWDEVP